MKKSSLMIIIGVVIFCIYIYVTNLGKLFYKRDYDKFDFNSAKEETTLYLKENKKELENIADELYKSKTTQNNPYKNVSYVSYHNYPKNNNSLENTEYIIFDLDSQGMLGGQYYGLIYSKNKNIYNGNSLAIYDENKETGNGNNIEIRKKIDNNWFFYYDDYDGKVQINSIK